VAVYCSSAVNIEEKFLDFAYEVGKKIADAGFDLVWGGGQISMMGAVSRGARDAGAATYGVIPEKLLNREFIDDDATEIFIVSDMRTRKGKIEELSDAFIALPGGIGTFEEFFEIWVGHYLGFHNKPIAMCDPYGDWDLVQKAINHLENISMVKDGQRELIDWNISIDEILNKFKNKLN
jgi:uncharacterized protein (TIGR00730 family)